MPNLPPRLTLVLGGARSGKSAHAEGLIEACPAPWLYLATAQAWDDEMRDRIALHRKRRSADWITRDVPMDLAGAVAAAPGPVLVDCLTLWLTNLILAEADVEAATAALLAACAAAPGPVVLVGNEVGLGIVPDNVLARRFRDAAGRLHQRLARQADHVVFLVAGLPLIVKPQAGATP
ncbi:bifunctional adenosylcobinamide kinase/adenosylcobinamide-phosphate guanylyltransferase [Methylobacterium sp. Leaf117]|uniref:bifunctional adenosylcobinamide kinase/adenosylcobinamide-phosphate guanylyltransferase n=1 Tax=Methylobacterium sp. Leaf117 TaxID=1736260 RepID=UPI000AE8537D|nr:bifunctional adenosylcobinamide kinase/adenosylcobinamide-phosphate guanylyltransferase [Methylobacterium sp. Leaf117]